MKPGVLAILTYAVISSLFLLPSVAHADVADTTLPIAPGYGALPYKLPPPGSYRLPPIGIAPDGEVLDDEGHVRNLYSLYDNKIVLLSFIYSRCTDVNACPLANYTFYKIKAAMQHDPVLAKSLVLITLSFDPTYDTPAVMRLYGANFTYAGPKGQWYFLTTASEAGLRKVLKAYDQTIQVNPNTISHVLRVFLIDRKKRIRNIYSVGFLHPDMLLDDVRTLLMHEEAPSQARTEARTKATLSVPGDNIQGYESSSYKTHSQALQQRVGKPADLMKYAKQPPLGLPPVPVPQNNPLTRAKIALGRKLFYDRRLSLNDTQSCAMCHIPEQGFTSNSMATAVGVEGQTVRRNSPTLYNVAYTRRLFHDGREDELEQQIWAPLLNKNEMGNPAPGWLLDKLRKLPDYKSLFDTIFSDRGLDMGTLGMAIASYERTLVSGNSAFDRWYYGHDNLALSMSAQRGFKLFVGKAHCSACHTVGKDTALFMDNQLHNTGLGYRDSMGIAPAKERVVLAPGVFVEVDQSIINANGESPPADVGLYEVTQNPRDRWKYTTSTLRNIALTSPYMHNGALSTLREVVEFYNQGGVPNELLDPLIKPLSLNKQEIDDLIEFLKSLTGDNVNTLVADGFAAPVGDNNNLDHPDTDWANQITP